MDSRPRRMDGYIRVSRVAGREGASYTSPDHQRERIESWAGFQGVEIAHWELDEDQSGGTQNRPGFRRIMDRIEAREVDGVVCWKLHRFARNVADAIRDVQAIQEAGAHLACVDDQIDPTGPFGNFVLTVMLAVATLERDNLVESWKAAKSRAIARGAHIGPTPVGYLRHEGGDLSGRLHLHPIQGPAVTELFHRRLAGASWSELARLLDRSAPRGDGGVWTLTQIKRVISGRVYLGEVRNGHLVNATAHEPLIDRETWKGCQRRPGRQKVANSPFLLTGLLRCAGCRYAMSGWSTGGTNRDTRVYKCNRRHGSGICARPATITAHIVESHVLDTMRGHLDGFRVEGISVGAGLDELQEELRLLEEEVDVFASDPHARRLLGDDWSRMLEIRVQARDAKRGELEEAERKADVRQHIEIDWDDLDAELLSRALSASMQAVFIRKGHGAVSDRAHVVWTDDPVVELPRRGKVVGPFDLGTPGDAKAHSGMASA